MLRPNFNFRHSSRWRQKIRRRSIGSGCAVALQNFFENVAMLLTVGLYTLATTQGVQPVPAIFTVGMLVLVATFRVSWHLPPDPSPGDSGKPAA